VRPGPTFAVGERRVLFPASAYDFSGSYPLYDVAPDDRRFLMVRGVSPEGETEAILIQNWFQELKARTGR
jgi:hypothetical protein